MIFCSVGIIFDNHRLCEVVWSGFKINLIESARIEHSKTPSKTNKTHMKIKELFPGFYPPKEGWKEPGEC